LTCRGGGWEKRIRGKKTPIQGLYGKVRIIFNEQPGYFSSGSVSRELFQKKVVKKKECVAREAGDRLASFQRESA